MHMHVPLLLYILVYDAFSFAASLFQPLETMALAQNEQPRTFLTKINQLNHHPSFKLLESALEFCGFSRDLVEVYDAFCEARDEEVRKQIARAGAENFPDLAWGIKIKVIKSIS